MPFYYSIELAVTTNGTASTLTDHLRLLTIANQTSCSITGLSGGGTGTTVGGIVLRLGRYTTPSSSGSSATPAKRNPNAPGASTTAFSAPTAGTTFTVQQAVGINAAGGMGGWSAIEPDESIVLLPNGGATGNADVESIAAGTSQTLDFTLTFNE